MLCSLPLTRIGVRTLSAPRHAPAVLRRIAVTVAFSDNVRKPVSRSRVRGPGNKRWKARLAKPRPQRPGLVADPLQPRGVEEVQGPRPLPRAAAGAQQRDVALDWWDERRRAPRVTESAEMPRKPAWEKELENGTTENTSKLPERVLVPLRTRLREFGCAPPRHIPGRRPRASAVFEGPRTGCSGPAAFCPTTKTLRLDLCCHSRPFADRPLSGHPGLLICGMFGRSCRACSLGSQPALVSGGRALLRPTATSAVFVRAPRCSSLALHKPSRCWGLLWRPSPQACRQGRLSILHL